MTSPPRRGWPAFPPSSQPIRQQNYEGTDRPHSPDRRTYPHWRASRLSQASRRSPRTPRRRSEPSACSLQEVAK